MLQSPVDRHIVVDGVRLAYCDHGHGEPVVFVHGTPSHTVIWREVLPQVSRAGYRVVGYDLLGYGYSERPMRRDTSVTAQAALLEQLLTSLGIGEVTLVGHDIGGAVAQILATQNPDRVRRLLLIDTVSYNSWPSPTWRAIIDEQLDDHATMSATAFEAMLTEQLEMTVVDRRRMSQAVREAYLDVHRSPLGRISFFEHQVRHYDSIHTQRLTALLGRLTMPVRLLWGAEDAWQSVSYAHRLAAAIPGSTEPAVVAGAGHFLPEEAPDVVVEQVLDLLAVAAGTTAGATGHGCEGAGVEP
ncbi:alpha/beta fold hydrolase [Salinactinospora qingdaonensis]